MAHQTLSVLHSPDFPQVLLSAIDRAVTLSLRRIEARPLLGTCDYEGEGFECSAPATVHHIEFEREFCAAHFQKVVGRG